MPDRRLAPTFVVRRAGERIGGFWVDVRCSRCGGHLIHEASGTPGTETRAIARCQDCLRPWQVLVTLLDETESLGRRRQPDGPNFAHGTRAAYARGCKCDQCRAAGADYQADVRRRRGVVA